MLEGKTRKEGLMRALVQRVTHAQVDIDGETVGSCEHGYLVLLGVGADDGPDLFIDQSQTGLQWKKDFEQRQDAGLHIYENLQQYPIYQPWIRIFADPEERVPFEITLALTPAGPQAWGKRLLNDVQLAVEYRNGCIYYEAAIPWTVFPGKLKHCVSKKGFLYGIAINDDDAIVPRRFLERFDGSIVHGKRVDAFAPVSLGNSIRDTKPAKTVFFENFSQDANGKTPLRWFNHTSRMPENSNVVESSPGAEDGKALVLRNQNGVRPNRFAINVAALQLQPGKKYELSARMNRIPADCSTVVGVCADIWGNKDQKFLKLSPVSGYRVFKRDFTAPLNGKCNVIIKNVCKLDGLQIDWIKIKEKE